MTGLEAAKIAASMGTPVVTSSGGHWYSVKPANSATGLSIGLHGSESSAKSALSNSGRSSSGSGGSGSSSVASSVLSGTSTLDEYLKRLQAIVEANNAWSAQQAQKQMDYQTASDEKAMTFSADQALLNRNWQEYMSNTAHQREVKDLQAAGLNPVLSAMGGNGAAVTSGSAASGYSSQGAKGDTDTSLSGVLVSLLGAVIQSQTAMANTLTSAQAQERIAQLGYKSDLLRQMMASSSAREVANIQGETSRDVANIQGQTSRVVASISASATRDAAATHAAGQVAASRVAAQANLSIAQTNQLTSIVTHAIDNISREGIAAANRDLQKELQQNNFDFQMSFAEDQYTRDWKLHMWDNGTDLLQSLFSSGAGSGLVGLLASFLG